MKVTTLTHEDSLVRSFFFFTQLAGAAIKYADSEFWREQHISLPRYMILHILVSNNGMMKHSEIARWTNTEKHNISAFVGRMREEGLVTTEWSKEDRRVNYVVLTDKGRQVYENAHPMANRTIRKLMQGFEKGDARELERLLSIIKKNVENN